MGSPPESGCDLCQCSCTSSRPCIYIPSKPRRRQGHNCRKATLSGSYKHAKGTNIDDDQRNPVSPDEGEGEGEGEGGFADTPEFQQLRATARDRMAAGLSIVEEALSSED